MTPQFFNNLQDINTENIFNTEDINSDPMGNLDLNELYKTTSFSFSPTPPAHEDDEIEKYKKIIEEQKKMIDDLNKKLLNAQTDCDTQRINNIDNKDVDIP